MSAQESPVEIRNASLDGLEPLVGTWRAQISDADFLDGDSRLTGTMTASWLDGRAFLVLRSVIDGGPPTSVQVIGRNEEQDEFDLLYADERGVSRVYTMTFSDGEWTQERRDPGFHQRFTGTLSKGGDHVEATWSKSHGGGATWSHDFAVTYVRV